MQHLAIIPDGNRRWAAKNKLRSFLGHKRGMEAVESAIKICIVNGIKFLSFYTFSLENFRRSNEEKQYLFKLITTEVKRQLPKLIKQEVRIRFLGDCNVFPESTRESIEFIENKTKILDKLQLNLLFCYGAQQEMVHAVKTLAKKIKDKLLSINEINIDEIKNSLWTKGIPDPDLIIRTGNVMRLSNFLLYQAAYSEFLFLDRFWPEINEEILKNCLAKFITVKRNFGA
jgi:undecaprenyl diphosphate synthase